MKPFYADLFDARRGWRAVVSGRFLWRVLTRFLENQGFLLAGAVAFYSLLSVVPMFALLLVLLSQLVDEQLLLGTITRELRLLTPSGAEALAREIQGFLAHREIAGGVGLLVLLFFGSQAFLVLERAMGVIFHHRRGIVRRHLITTALIPFFYFAALGAGLVAVSLATGFLEALGSESVHIFDFTIPLGATIGLVVHGIGIFSELVMFSSLYHVLPAGRVPWRHALVGGAFATFFWEVARRLLVWWLAHFSLISLVYGSLATAVVALLALELAAVIILLGAQVIAEYEQLGAVSPQPGPPGPPRPADPAATPRSVETPARGPRR